MNGKILKVVEYNLTFGSAERFVNVFGCFKYKPSNSLYLLYADVDSKYNVIYYGSSHIKENAILAMGCKDKKDEEIIKEYIFKVTNKESLDDFLMISLDNIEGVEIISSNKLTVKMEVLTSLIEATIPKPEVKEATVKVTSVKKKKGSKSMLLLFVLILVLGGAGLYYCLFIPKDNSIKDISCTKQYAHEVLNSTVDESVVYYFNYQDSLEKIDTITIYKFHNEKDYQDFINKGTYYKYMPEDDIQGGWDIDDTNYTFKIITKEEVDSSYKKPTGYEEVLSYLKRDGYTCTENIKKES